MISLSVNVNKIATLRNSRGGDIPDVLTAVDTCIAAGAQGITVHPREDERHIRPADVLDIAERLIEINTQKSPTIEYNIEGDPRPDLIDMVLTHETNSMHACSCCSRRDNKSYRLGYPQRWRYVETAHHSVEKRRHSRESV